MSRRHPYPILPLVVWLFLLSLTAGCSYFNAYYNTKTYFRSGEQERERSTTLNSKPAGYTKAVDAGGRLIEYYPDSKYIDDALFIMGQSYYWLEDYHKALRKFEELQANYPESPHIEESKLWVGRTNVKLRKRQEATSILRGLIGDTEDSQLINGALFALAELYYDDSLFVKAEEEFARITETARDEKILGESYWRAGEAAFREKRYDNAIKHLTRALNYSNTRSLTFQIQLLLGRSLLLSDQPKQAMEKFNALLSDKRYYEEHGRVRVQLALTMVELGEIDKAMVELDRVIEEYKRSDAAAQAYYEKGMIELQILGERRGAKISFDKGRVEKSRSPYAMKADTMLNLVNRVDNLGLSRKKIAERMDLTQKWIADPVDPQQDSLLRTKIYYDSLAFDSLRLIRLFSFAYRDSVILPPQDLTPPDTTLIDSLQREEEDDDSLSLAPFDNSHHVTEDQNTSLLSDSLVVETSSNDTASRVEVPDSAGSPEPDESLRLQTFPVDTVTPSFHIIDSPESDSLSPGPVVYEHVVADTDSVRIHTSELEEVEAKPDTRQRPILPGTLEDAFGEGEFGTEQIAAPSDMSQFIRDSQLGPTSRGLLSDSVVSPMLSEEPIPVTTIRIFDPQPVHDSLAVMRASLQDIRFQLGEVLLFNLNQPDSARTIFEELAHPPSVDSVQARATLALSYIAREAGDTTLADSLFRRLATDFAGTRHGKYAWKELGHEVRESQQPDIEAFNEAERLYLVEGNPNEAFTRYRWLVSTYPDSPWAPKALFASAWIVGNELDEPKMAEELFNELATNYPRSEQAIRAEAILADVARRRNAEASGDTTSLKEEYADIVAFGEEEIDQMPEIVGDMSALSSILESRSLLPQEVIQGTGGEVLLRYIVDDQGNVSGFRVVLEDPPGRGLARALISGLEDVTFRPGIKDGLRVVTRVEKRFTLPLDAPPNTRPLPRRRR